MRHVEHLFPIMGAKGNFTPEIMPVLRRLAIGATTYMEPFAGSAAIGLRALFDFPSARHIWNDADPAIIAVWAAVRDKPDELIDKVLAYTPTVEDFYRFKSLPPDGFRRLVIGYTTWSGNGSGCRGGKTQRYERIGERWNRGLIAKKIRLIHRWMTQNKLELSCEDFEAVIPHADDRTLMFIDPPYHVSNHYYGRDMSAEDHERLAALLSTTPARWVLTYGDDTEVWRLYAQWCRIEDIGHRNLLITPKDQNGKQERELSRLR